jgi:two-component system, NtrC family, response regulator AtoC
MGRVLLVDDDPNVRFTLAEVMAERGHEAITASSGEEALQKLDGIEVVVVDLAMPGMDGMRLLRELRGRDESLPVIMLTAQGSERIAVEATKAGAYDYLAKPFDIDEVVLVVERGLETHRLRSINRRLTAEQALGFKIVSESPPMRKLLSDVARIASRDVTVLVTGETGTGKELVASLLHAQSKRASMPLVRFNCAAIPAELADAELFGHAKGAFTGAAAAREGYIAQANGGTLVLDEIGELPMSVQPKLLRAIQEGEIQPLGSGRIERVNVRLVASTHRNLEAEVKAGRFREDLYYRLAVIVLRVPPLRERREDIAPLAHEFARRFAEKFGTDGTRLSPELIDRLVVAEWPGNVRQLENMVARFVGLSSGGEIGEEAFAGGTAPRAPATADEAGAEAVEGLTLKEQVDAFERSVVLRTFTAAGKNQSETARRLGVSRVTIIDKLKKHGIG